MRIKEVMAKIEEELKQVIGIPQTRGVINGRVAYKHPFIEVIAKFVGGILALKETNIRIPHINRKRGRYQYHLG